MDLSKSLGGVEQAYGYGCESLMAIESDRATLNGVSVTLDQKSRPASFFPLNY